MSVAPSCFALQQSIFERTKTAFGGLDIVCNNADIADEQNWKKMINVNLVKQHIGSHAAAKLSVLPWCRMQ